MTNPSTVATEVGVEVAHFMGYNNLKSEQEQIIINGIATSKRDVFGILPSAFGKSPYFSYWRLY